MNEAGALARSYGLQFFHHNHNFEFVNKQQPADRRSTTSFSRRPTGSWSSSSSTFLVWGSRDAGIRYLEQVRF